jgi:hypothetical protein
MTERKQGDDSLETGGVRGSRSWPGFGRGGLAKERLAYVLGRMQSPASLPLN